MSKTRLQDGFEPVWIEDFRAMREVGMRAWALNLYMCLARDHLTGLCKISELQIQRDLGWDPKTTRQQLRTLIKFGYIVPEGYLTYVVKSWRRLSTTSGISPDLKKNSTREKLPTTSGKTPDLPRENFPTTSGKTPDPIYTESELQNKNTADESIEAVDKSKDLKNLVNNLSKELTP